MTSSLEKPDDKQVIENRGYVTLQVIIYVILYSLAAIGHAISPTNMAGPGLDFMIVLAITAYAMFSIVLNVRRSFKLDKTYLTRALIHFLFLFIPTIITLLISVL